MNTYDHINPEFRYVLEQSDIKRMLFAEGSRWIEYPKAVAILRRLDWLMQVPKRSRMPCMLIIGDPNNGKTTLVEKFFHRYGKQYVNNRGEPVKPVILAQAPPKADERSLHLSLLDLFQAPHRPTALVPILRRDAIRWFEKCNVKILIIDEFHSLLNGRGKSLFEVMSVIRTFCNTLRIPIVGVGTREAVQVLHNDAQHVSRFKIIEELPLWSLDRDFLELLDMFEQTLPLKKQSNLQQPELAPSLFTYSGGNLGNLRNLLVECAKEAIAGGTEQIDKALLDATVKKNPWLLATGI